MSMYIPVPVREYLRKTNPDVLRQMEQDPNLANILDSMMPVPNSDLAQNLSLLSMLHGNAPGSLEMAPKAATFLSSTLARGLSLRTISDANVPRRPTEVGLPHALLTMANLREQFRGTKLASLNMDPNAMRAKVAQITALRGCLTPTIAVLRGMTRNLAWIEAACVTELREDFELCRSMAGADPELAPLESVEDYLYGSAAKGAETRRDNRRTFEDMTLKAEKSGMAAANRKARSTVTQELEGLLQDIRRTEPLSEENRKDPR